MFNQLISIQTYETSWMALLIPVSVAILLMWIPGLLIGFTGGLRRRQLFAWAPVGSVATISIAAVVMPWIASSWNLVWVIMVLVPLILLAHIVYRAVGGTRKTKLASLEKHHGVDTKQDSYRIHCIALFILFGFIFILGLVHYAELVETPKAFAQVWDNYFHLNVIQRIIDGYSPSSLNISSSPIGQGAFYPAAWHDVASLIAILTGAPATIAQTALKLVVSYLVWPVGVYALACAATRNRYIRYTSIPLSIAFPQFPNMFLSYGVIYPNMLAITLLPSMMACVVRGLRLWNRYTWIQVFFVGLGIFGLVLAQPNVLIAFLIMAIATFWGFHVHKIWKQRKTRRIILTIGSTFLWIVILLLFNFALDLIPKISMMRQAAEWNPQGTLLQGVFQLLSASGGRPESNVYLVSISDMAPLGLLVLIGLLVLVVRRKQLWIFAVYLLFGGLFLASFVLTGEIRSYITGIWYTEPVRVWALLMVLLPVLSAAGVWGIAALFRYSIQRFLLKKRVLPLKAIYFKWISLFITVVICSGLGYWGLYGQHAQRVNWGIKVTYSFSQERAAVDLDEYELFSWMRGHLPSDAVVVGNAWEGASFAWAIGQTRTLYPTLNNPENKDLVYLARHLNEASYNRRVREIIDQYHVTHALDLKDVFLGGSISKKNKDYYAGFDGIADASIGNVVKRVGDAKLVKLAVSN